jgi:putative transposase
MPYRKDHIENNSFYHLYNRGNNKQNIFFEEMNYHYFLDVVKKYFIKGAIHIHAYCLMPNHFHFIIETTSDADVSRFIQHSMIAYVKAINKRYDRVGHLFQDRFKIKNIDSTEYLLHLSRYIHINPVMAGLVKVPELWDFSSYQSYIRNKVQNEITTEFILSHFKNAQEYKIFVESFAKERFIELQNQFWISKYLNTSPKS